MEEQIKALKNLGLTDEEIAEVLADDVKIDKGQKMFELPKELEQGASKARRAGNCKGYTKPQKQQDQHRLNLIANLIQGLQDHSPPEELKIKNPEREFEFILYGKKFRVVLSCPRS